MLRRAFTLIEIIFVIIVIGIIGSFGVEAMFGAYENYIFSTAQARLQSQSEAAANQIANRLQYRVKDSAIARDRATNAFVPLANAGIGATQDILEWVGVDREGWQGINQPYWSGFIDLDALNNNGPGLGAAGAPLYLNPAVSGLAIATRIISPGSNTANITNMIIALSNGGSTFTDAALYFVGSDVDVQAGFGWNGVALANQNGTMHPGISASAVGQPLNEFHFNDIAGGLNFTGQNVYEYYQLAWTAYAVVHQNNILTLFYDYQPWAGETFRDGKSAILMEDVDTFGFRSIGDVIKIQVCVTDNNIFGDGGYSVCKEKTVF